MKAKFILISLLIAAALVLTGCGKKEEGTGTGTAPAPAPQDNYTPKSPSPAAPPPAADAKPGEDGAKSTRAVTVLDPLPDTVAAETVEIKGKTRAGKRIFINGQEVTPDAGQFSFPFNLQVGKNEIRVVTLGKDGVEGSQTLSVERRPTPPRLTVISPDRSDAENITISGQTEKGCIIYVNTTLARPDREGNFTSSVRLKEGINNIKITSTNRDGGTATVQKTVSFNPSNPRLVAVIPDESKNKQVTISGITDTDTVLVLYVNDVRSDINLQNGVFSGTITLEDGVNTVNITAVNKWGKSSTFSRNILYIAP